MRARITEAQKNQLAKLSAAGHTPETVADKLALGVAQVKHWQRELGLHSATWTKEHEVQIIRGLRKGESWEKIAHTRIRPMGRCYTTARQVYAHVNDMRAAKSRKGKLSPKDVAAGLKDIELPPAPVKPKKTVPETKAKTKAKTRAKTRANGHAPEPVRLERAGNATAPRPGTIQLTWSNGRVALAEATDDEMRTILSILTGG
jgi:hypothetical protein